MRWGMARKSRGRQRSHWGEPDRKRRQAPRRMGIRVGVRGEWRLGRGGRNNGRFGARVGEAR